MAQAIQDNPEIGAVLQSYQQGDYDGLLNSQAALQALADSTGVSVDVIITNITQELRAKGVTDGQLVAIDGDSSNRKDVIKTTAHELDHVRGGSSETLANLAGIAADLNVSASIDANQDKIDVYKPALGDGKDTATQEQNKQLLEQNNIEFIDNLLQNPENIDYSSSFVDGAVTVTKRAAGGLAGVAVSVGQIGEPFLHPIDTYNGLKQFANEEDKKLAIQLAVAYELQQRADLYNMHVANGSEFGQGLEASRNSLDAVFIGVSITKAPSSLLKILPALKKAGRVTYGGATYVLKNGKITVAKVVDAAFAPSNKIASQRGSVDLSAFDVTSIIKGIKVGKKHPSTGHVTIASVPRVLSSTDDLVASTKPSSKNIVYKTHYYEDPGHHNPKGGNVAYNQKKSVLPSNHIELFKNSREYKGVRYAKDSNNNIHQFQDSTGDGTAYHWAGSQNGKTLSGQKSPLTVPKEVKKDDFWK